MKRNDMIAMILAGGRGSRLHDLTAKVAKPAVSYGGKYRIVDFPLSNCANSGINVVGVLTQYESVLLGSYASKSQYWGLDTRDSGVYVLPPREKADAALDVYRGTADAITENIDFIDSYNPKHLLVLSGDHIYKMNYDKMLKYHKEQNATATIAVMPVTMEEATRFGIMITDEENRIIDFEEKPAHPRSTLASMGIYIFDWPKLRALLLEDKDDPNSDHDFGKNIIPTLLKNDEKMVAFKFEGYWKDVGTIDSLWEANMDLLRDDNDLNLGDTSWKIYTGDTTVLPAKIGPNAKIKNAYVPQGTCIDGKLDTAVIFTGAKIGKDAEIKDTVLMTNVVVEEGAKVTRALVADGVTIGKGAVVGSADSKEILLVAQDVKGVE